MADMMKSMGGSAGKRGSMMGKLGQMMGIGGAMPAPSAEDVAQMQKSLGGAGAPGIPSAPPPGAFSLPAQFPGLAGKPPGLGGFNPLGGKKK
jgi:signal recognition particle subunit SRP54